MLTLGWQLVFTIANLIILVILLRLFLFKPVLKIIDERKAQIEKGFQDVAHEKQALNAAKEETACETKRLQQEAQQIMEAAQTRASITEKEIIEKARVQADGILETASKKAEQERNQIIQGTKKELVDIAMKTAEQILREKAQTKEEAPSLLSFIDEMEGPEA